MKDLNWRVVIELVGVSAIVVSLGFVIVELRQARSIATTEAFSALESSAVAARDAINLNIDIWERGAAGEKLSSAEAAIFGNLVFNLNSQAIGTYIINRTFSSEQDAIMARNDFAIFLHQNPGARDAWQEWEENMGQYRRILAPEIPGLRASWYEDISASLEALDAAIE